MKRSFDVRKHILVPKHVKLTEEEKKKLLGEYNLSLMELPKISVRDPAIAHLNVKEGDVIRIIRVSPTSGEAVFYRGVVNV